jgi:hypothetical protein
VRHGINERGEPTTSVVVDELVEFERNLVEVQGIREMTTHFGGI